VFGQRTPAQEKVREWFAKIGAPKAKGGLTIAGIVARIIHDGRLLGAYTHDLSNTLRRVDRVLRRLANPVK
jgi:hypothetical protein